MSGYEQAVFISYAWGGEREEIVNQIDQALQKRGIKIIRDKRDLGYKGSISQFMERIGRGDCIIVVISDKYLRSPNCMYELVEIADNKDIRDRIFPIVLQDADIYDPVHRIKYIKHWEEKRAELAEAIKTLDPANLQGIREEIDLYDHIRDKISGLASALKDMNTLTPDMHQESDFNDLYNALEKRLKENPAHPAFVNPPIEIKYFEPETVFIPEGSFWMGSEPGPGIPAFEMPQHEIVLPAYRIGKYPVTNAQFEEFIIQTGRPVSPGMGWDGQRVPENLRMYPVIGVDWNEAIAYCKWLSEATGRKYSLPNEAQWEKACRGGDKRLFPWGNEFDSTRCNFGNSTLATVDAFPAQSENGCYDWVGNTRQWTITLWGEKRIAPDPEFAYPWKDDRRNDLKANNPLRRVLRGSSYKDDIKQMRCCNRIGQVPDEAGSPGNGYSFRVVLFI